MPGSAVIERLLRDSGGQWWVDQSGVTQLGQRANPQAQLGSYNVLTYSPLNRTATIGFDDPAALWVGSVIYRSTQRTADNSRAGIAH